MEIHALCIRPIFVQFLLKFRRFILIQIIFDMLFFQNIICFIANVNSCYYVTKSQSFDVEWTVFKPYAKVFNDITRAMYGNRSICMSYGNGSISSLEQQTSNESSDPIKYNDLIMIHISALFWLTTRSTREKTDTQKSVDIAPWN